MKQQFVVIHWTDAAIHPADSYSAQYVKEKLGLVSGYSCGWLVDEDKKKITIAMDYFYTEDQYRILSTYPKSGIHKIIRKNMNTDPLKEKKK